MAAGTAVAASIAGTALTIQGQRKAAKAQARAARDNANSKRLQALELLDRFEINSQALFIQGESVKSEQALSFASRGIDATTGTALSVVEETNAIIAKQLILDKREADFKSAQLFSGAEADIRLAGDIRSSQRLQTLGSILSGGVSAGVAGSKLGGK
jgi:hypothetical protein